MRRRTWGVDVELGEAGAEIAAALMREVHKHQRRGLRQRLNRLYIPGSAAVDQSFGALVREREPPAARGWVDELLDLVAAVEAGTTSWEVLREWCWLSKRWSTGRKPDGPRRRTAFWLAASEAARWVVMRHRGWDGELDGQLGAVELKRILERLGWRVSYSPRNLRVQLAVWQRTLPTVSPPVPAGWHTVRRGRLVIVASPIKPHARRRRRS